MDGNAKGVIWLASYPKSGNTWVRFLLCNLLRGPQDSAAALSQLIPDVHEIGPLPQLPATRLLLKTHFCFSAQMPHARDTLAAIYIVRHPADVLLSNFHYSQRSGAPLSNSEQQLVRYVQQFLAARGDARWRRLGMGTWDENVRSWLDSARSFPLLTLRYEDLLADAYTQANRLARFLTLERSAEQIEQAVAASTFERLRAIEEADIAQERVGIFYKPYLRASIAAGLRFMRTGLGGQGTQGLSPEQHRGLLELFAPTLQRCGYATEFDAVTS